MNSALWNGATCEMYSEKFDADKIWKKLLREQDALSVFMAVPTIYNNLVKHLEEGHLGNISRDEIK